MRKCVVVGSGIAGLVSALLLSKKGFSVTLIEAASELGGLLKSYKNDDGLHFDCGTHFLRQTQIPEIDELLFSDLDSNWRTIPGGLHAATWNRNILNSESPFLNTAVLTADIQQKVEQEILLQPESYSYENALDFCNKRWGTTLTEELIRPISNKLFCGEPLENLSASALKIFEFSRVIAFTPEKVRELKKIKWHDDRLAFHSYREGGSQILNFYPKNEGIGLFIKIIETKLKSLNVTIYKNAKITNATHSKGTITSLELNHELPLTTDLLVWTAPIPFLNKLTGYTQNHNGQPLQLNKSVIYDFVFNMPFTSDAFYLVCHDSNLKSFRITLYPNCSGYKSKNKAHCSVEVLMPANSEPFTFESIVKELYTMKIVPLECQLLYYKVRQESSGFPVLTKNFEQTCKTSLDFANNIYKNCVFVGKSKGDVFFMNDTIIDAYDTIQRL